MCLHSKPIKVVVVVFFLLELSQFLVHFLNDLLLEANLSPLHHLLARGLSVLRELILE